MRGRVRPRRRRRPSVCCTACDRTPRPLRRPQRPPRLKTSNSWLAAAQGGRQRLRRQRFRYDGGADVAPVDLGSGGGGGGGGGAVGALAVAEDGSAAGKVVCCGGAAALLPSPADSRGRALPSLHAVDGSKHPPALRVVTFGGIGGGGGEGFGRGGADCGVCISTVSGLAGSSKGGFHDRKHRAPRVEAFEHLHRAPVTAVACAEDGSCLATGSADGVVRLWTVSAGFVGEYLPSQFIV